MRTFKWYCTLGPCAIVTELFFITVIDRGNYTVLYEAISIYGTAYSDILVASNNYNLENAGYKNLINVRQF